MSLSSVYPQPPSYYKHFTKENLDKLKDLQSKDEYKEEDLEAPLSYLVPPSPPKDKPYRSFGHVWQPEDKLQTLEEVGIKQLYGEITTPNDRIQELKKMLRSLLANYLELTGIMSLHPEQFPDKLEDIRVLLINMHHLLNEYRPHQSRENLIMLMDSQIKQKRNEIDSLRSKNTEIFEKIQGTAKQFDLSQPTVEQKKQDAPNDKEQSNKQKDIELWKMLQEQL